MIQRKTVLILGAGASKECDFPTGQELKVEIANLLNFRFENAFEASSGDETVYEAMTRVRQQWQWKARAFNFDAAAQIRDAMPQAISIDNYIDAHYGNKSLELIGKLAIAKAILASEKRSSMYVDMRNVGARPNYRALEDSWFCAFMQLLTENGREEDLDPRFESLALIVFNYDRCIEHYIYHWLQTYYRVTPQRAASLVNKLDIFHPYGVVGNLPWQTGGYATAFGEEIGATSLIDLATQIKTFTESTDPSGSDIVRIRKKIAEAEIVLFLGFAYHRQNLRLLQTGEAHQAPNRVRYFGTALGLSDSDRAQVATELTELASVSHLNVTLRGDLTCARMFREYWRSLALS